MDLEKMEEKLDCGQYKTFTEFHNDFKLIVSNCRLYNGQNNGNGKHPINFSFIGAPFFHVVLMIILFNFRIHRNG